MRVCVVCVRSVMFGSWEEGGLDLIIVPHRMAWVKHLMKSLFACQMLLSVNSFLDRDFKDTYS